MIVNKILVTGATGFVGSALTAELLFQEYDVVVSVRRSLSKLSPKIKQVNTGELLPTTNWVDVVNEVDVVIHLARHELMFWMSMRMSH